jgi:hypothetical protein
MERQALDRVPEHGGGIKLQVSSGAVRKLLRGASDKTDALPYAVFIKLCLQGAEIEVPKRMWGAPVPESTVIEDVEIDWQEYKNPHFAVDTPSMGLVYVTMHAIEKYGERNDGGTPDRLLPSLIRRLKHPAIRQRVLPDYVLREKAMRYGRSDDVEAWSIPNQGMVFMVLNSGGRRTLVTTFFRVET